MAKRLRAKNNMVWGEVMNFYLLSGPIHVFFNKKGEGSIADNPLINEEILEHIQKMDPQNSFYEIYDDAPQESETMSEENKKPEEKEEETFEDLVNKTPDAKDDRKHGIDPIAKELEKPSKKDTHDDRIKSGVEADIRQTAKQEDIEDENSGVDPKKKLGSRNPRGAGKGLHGIAEVERDTVKKDQEENARSGVDTVKRDSSRKLTPEDNEKHGVSPDASKSSARKILGDDPRDELGTAPNSVLIEDPRRTLKEGKNDILYEDERDNLTSSPLDEPKAGDDPADQESAAKARKKV